MNALRRSVVCADAASGIQSGLDNRKDLHSTHLGGSCKAVSSSLWRWGIPVAFTSIHCEGKQRRGTRLCRPRPPHVTHPLHILTFRLSIYHTLPFPFYHPRPRCCSTIHHHSDANTPEV